MIVFRGNPKVLSAAMQEIFHVHLHVFPRVPGDGFGLKFGEDYFTKPTRAGLEQVGELIRKTIERNRYSEFRRPLESIIKR